MERELKFFNTRFAIFALAALPFHCFAGSDLEPIDDSMAVVLTPTRLRQSLADVPASVTVITAEMISNFGIRNIPDALRLVPGMAVAQVTGNDYRVNYHGTNILVPRRMNVLIDGISIYRAAFAQVNWKEMPIAIDDIERIEVTRGSNSASYGANSMLAIINIISKHPSEVDGTTFKVGYGTNSSASVMARHGGKIGESTTYRVSIERNQDQGFDSVFGKTPGHDSTRLNKLMFRSITEIGQNESLDLQADVVQGLKEIPFADKYQSSFPNITTQDFYLSALWRKSISPTHDVQIQAYVTQHRNDQPWTTCPPTAMFLPEMFALWQANPSYAGAILSGKKPSGGSASDNALAKAAIVAITKLGARAAQPTCVNANQNYSEHRADIEAQDTFVFSDNLRMVAGVGFRKDLGDSQTYLGGNANNNTWKAFSNIEYKPVKSLNINAGGFFEKDSITGSSFSPRLAANFHVNDNNTLRFVMSKAVRMPDIQEQRANWTYMATNFSSPLNGTNQGLFFQSARASGNLTGEKNTSKEIGLLMNYPQLGILFDAKVFEEKLDDLISEKLQLASFLPTNSNSATLRGAEFQLSYIPSDRWMAHMGYSYLINHASSIFEQSQYAKHSGMLSITHLLPSGWRASFAYYGYGAGTTGQTFYGREDLTFSKTFRLAKDVTVTPTLTFSYLNNSTSTYLVDVGQRRESSYNDSKQCYLTVKISY